MQALNVLYRRIKIMCSEYADNRRRRKRLEKEEKDVEWRISEKPRFRWTMDDGRRWVALGGEAKADVASSSLRPISPF